MAHTAAAARRAFCRFYCRFLLPLLLPFLVAIWQIPFALWYVVAKAEMPAAHKNRRLP